MSSNFENIHLIDADGEIASSDDITSFLNCQISRVVKEDANINTVGTMYRVVGIFGGQSSGKSTLLNAVFGTSFQIMEATRGRNQTTQGVFLSVAANKKVVDDGIITDPLLVSDFEGTDGSERGENQGFERKLSLFALSIADILVINMWAVEVGRFNAANLSLLRTVLEVNLQLFSHEVKKEETEINSKPTLLFVLRDHTNAELFEKNCESLRRGIDKIWGEITKPEGLEGCSIDRIFNVRYFAFPHFELQREQFQEAVKKFQAMFGLSAEGYNDTSKASSAIVPLFFSRSNYRDIPMEVLPQYLTNCWSAITKNKDLDIPSQRELVSRVRCKELVEQNIKWFCIFAEKQLLEVNASCVEGGTGRDKGNSSLGLRERLEGEYNRLVELFMVTTKLYSHNIVAEHRATLEKVLMKVFKKCMMEHCTLIVEDVLSNIEGDVQFLVDTCIRRCIWENESIHNIVELPLSSDKEANAETKSSKFDHSKDFETKENQASKNLDLTYEDVRDIVDNFWKTLAEMSNALAVQLSKAAAAASSADKENDADYSTKEFTIYDNSNQMPAMVLFGRYYKLLCQDQKLRVLIMPRLISALVNLLRKRCQIIMGDAAGAMHGTFEYILHHRRDGSVKFYSTTTGLQKQYRAARFGGLVLVACLFCFRLKISKNDGKEVDAKKDISDGSFCDDLFTRVFGTLDKLDHLMVVASQSVVGNNNLSSASDFYLDIGSANVAVDGGEISSSSSSNVGTGIIGIDLSLKAGDIINSAGTNFNSSDKPGRSAVCYGVYYPALTLSNTEIQNDRFLSQKHRLMMISDDYRVDYSIDEDHSVQESNSDGNEENEPAGEEGDGGIGNKNESNNKRKPSLSSAKSSDVNKINAAFDILLSKSALKRALELYQQKLALTFQIQLHNVESKESQRLNFANVPLPFWIALLYFAHDEVFYILTSPLLMLLILFIVFMFFGSWIKEQWSRFEESGPPVVVHGLKMAFAFIRPYVSIAQETFKSINNDIIKDCSKKNLANEGINNFGDSNEEEEQGDGKEKKEMGKREDTIRGSVLNSTKNIAACHISQNNGIFSSSSSKLSHKYADPSVFHSSGVGSVNKNSNINCNSNNSNITIEEGGTRQRVKRE